MKLFGREVKYRDTFWAKFGKQMTICVVNQLKNDSYC